MIISLIDYSIIVWTLLCHVEDMMALVWRGLSTSIIADKKPMTSHFSLEYDEKITPNSFMTSIMDTSHDGECPFQASAHVAELVIYWHPFHNISYKLSRHFIIWFTMLDVEEGLKKLSSTHWQICSREGQHYKLIFSKIPIGYYHFFVNALLRTKLIYWIKLIDDTHCPVSDQFTGCMLRFGLTAI